VQTSQTQTEAGRERYPPWHPTWVRAPPRASSPRADCQTEDVVFFGLPLLGLGTCSFGGKRGKLW
jgi:hypothetical protein